VLIARSNVKESDLRFSNISDSNSDSLFRTLSSSLMDEKVFMLQFYSYPGMPGGLKIGI
jgi:hypothetical protein